jgi:hypothetical protein
MFIVALLTQRNMLLTQRNIEEAAKSIRVAATTRWRNG